MVGPLAISVFLVVTEKATCNLSIVLLEILPEVQSLSVEDKWSLIDELWSDLAREVERAGVDKNALALLRGADAIDNYPFLAFILHYPIVFLSEWTP